MHILFLPRIGPCQLVMKAKRPFSIYFYLLAIAASSIYGKKRTILDIIFRVRVCGVVLRYCISLEQFVSSKITATQHFHFGSDQFKSSDVAFNSNHYVAQDDLSSMCQQAQKNSSLLCFRLQPASQAITSIVTYRYACTLPIILFMMYSLFNRHIQLLFIKHHQEHYLHCNSIRLLLC